MKKWSDDKKKMEQMDDILEPLCRALKHCYKLKRINANKDFPYDGFNLADEDLSMSVDPKTALSAKWIRKQLENGAVDMKAYKIILMLAFQLGGEQGRRDERRRR